MKNDNETQSKLLLSAKREFMEKGYMKASLRNICKEAGVTTGALYFFFQDKEDLFASLVEEPLEILLNIMKQHYSEELVDSEFKENGKLDFSDDLEVVKHVIHHSYQHYDEFQLLLTKSQGSRFEKCIDQIVEFSEKHYRILADMYSEQTNTKKLDDYIVHWFAHMQIDIFVHMLTHEKSEEAALQSMVSIMKYLMAGWSGLFDEI
ncbi:TetR/AcrR family transcriptional regulator [Anaerosacchariphilus polymeriproducens]|uniref:TetR/AcrR family transcriptional regulator n=1 Tax=Anaerosacchariphilus polymeriproducens TaxID=1812858 RepID=UPI00138FB9D6|nr:TetR/AcrR family transcriptional regulator [Anaerosacchariphilus polymeriproducens]